MVKMGDSVRDGRAVSLLLSMEDVWPQDGLLDGEHGLSVAKAFDRWWCEPVIVEKLSAVDAVVFPDEKARAWIRERIRLIAFAAFCDAVSEAEHQEGTLLW